MMMMKLQSLITTFYPAIGLVMAPSEAEFTKDAYFANTPVL
jgi:hypothetical protein